MRWAEHVALIEDRKVAYGDLVEIPAGKRSLGRSRRRWEGNIKMDV
jgi:hypothetical protein